MLCTLNLSLQNPCKLSKAVINPLNRWGDPVQIPQIYRVMELELWVEQCEIGTMIFWPTKIRVLYGFSLIEPRSCSWSMLFLKYLKKLTFCLAYDPVVLHFELFTSLCYFIPLQCPFPCLTYFRDPAMCSTKSLVIFVEAEVEWSPIPKLRPWICSLFTGLFNSPGLSFLISKMNSVHESQGLPMPLTLFPVILYRLLVQPFTFPSVGPLLYQQLHQPLAHLKDATLGKMHKLFLTLCPLPLLLLILGQTRWGGWVRGKLSNLESCHRGRSQI